MVVLVYDLIIREALIMIVGWGITILLLIIGIFLLFGKGSWLIAGYNTMNREEKAKYNKKKLCRSVGFNLLIVAVLMIILLFITQYSMKVNNKSIALYAALIFCFLVILLCVIGSLNANKCKIK